MDPLHALQLILENPAVPQSAAERAADAFPEVRAHVLRAGVFDLRAAAAAGDWGAVAAAAVAAQGKKG